MGAPVPRGNIPGINLKPKRPQVGLSRHGQPPPQGNQNSNGGPLVAVSGSMALICATVLKASSFSYTTGW